MKKIIAVGVVVCAVIASIVVLVQMNSGSRIELGEYKNLEIQLSSEVVTDDDVERAILDAVMAGQEAVEITDRPVASGDIANIDYIGKLDGVAFDGGSDQGFDLTIGSGSFIEGFEDQIIGMSKGETRDISVTFPDPYSGNAELSGRAAVFTVTVNSIRGKIVPAEITDAMIQAIAPDYPTLDAYRAHVRETLEATAAANSAQDKQQVAWEQVVENATVVKLSSKRVDYYAGLLELNYQTYADMYGVSLEEFIQTYMGMTREEYDAENSAFVTKALTAYEIAQAIAKNENLVITDEEYQAYITEFGITDEDVEIYDENIKDDLIYQKALEFVADHAIVL